MSNARIQKFLNHEELDEAAVDKVPLGLDKNSVKIERGSFRWSDNAEDPLILKESVPSTRVSITFHHDFLVVSMFRSGKVHLLPLLVASVRVKVVC